MTTTGIPVLDHAPNVAAEWLNELSGELGWTDNRRSYRLLRVTLHAVQDWLNVDEAADLAAQLPMLIRGLYFEGWNPSATPVHPRDKEEFVARVEKAFGNDPLDSPEDGISAVFRLLDAHISEGEIAQVQHLLQRKIREMWP